MHPECTKTVSVIIDWTSLSNKKNFAPVVILLSKLILPSFIVRLFLFFVIP